VEALSGKSQVLCVSYPSNETNGLSITWPYLIDEHGPSKRIVISSLGVNAEKLLEKLIETREKERKHNASLN